MDYKTRLNAILEHLKAGGSVMTVTAYKAIWKITLKSILYGAGEWRVHKRGNSYTLCPSMTGGEPPPIMPIKINHPRNHKRKIQ